MRAEGSRSEYSPTNFGDPNQTYRSQRYSSQVYSDQADTYRNEPSTSSKKGKEIATDQYSYSNTGSTGSGRGRTGESSQHSAGSSGWSQGQQRYQAEPVNEYASGVARQNASSSSMGAASPDYSMAENVVRNEGGTYTYGSRPNTASDSRSLMVTDEVTGKTAYNLEQLRKDGCDFDERDYEPSSILGYYTLKKTRSSGAAGHLPGSAYRTVDQPTYAQPNRPQGQAMGTQNLNDRWSPTQGGQQSLDDDGDVDMEQAQDANYQSSAQAPPAQLTETENPSSKDQYGSWVCPLCEIPKARSRDFEVHMRNHHGITWRVHRTCPVCREVFKTEREKDTH